MLFMKPRSGTSNATLFNFIKMLLPLGVSLWVRRDMRLFSLYLLCNLIPFILNQYFIQSILDNSIISFTAHLILFTGTIALYSDILLLALLNFP